MKTSRDYPYSNKTIYGIKSDAARYTWAGYYLFILISSLVGDTIILIASLKYRAFNLHKVIIVIIQHIALCDLMVTIMAVVPTIVFLISNEWMFGDFLCYLSTYTRYYCYLTSILLICNMTTSKLLLLKYPFRCETISVTKAHTSGGACWLAALILPATTLIVTGLDGHWDIYFSYGNYICEYGFMSETWGWLRPLLTVLVIFTPNCLVVATTVYLLVIAKHVARRGRESLKWQGIMTTVLTATVYCISVLPFAVYNFAESIVTVDDESTSFFHTSFYRIAVSFPYLNTISNFYIYSLSVHSFRDFLWSRIQQTYRIFNSIATLPSNGEGIAFQLIM